MSIVVSFHRLAAVEYATARRWYFKRSTSAERRFAQAVDEAVGRVETNPNLGSLTFGSYRWVRLKKFPFLLYFRLYGQSNVEIFALSHSRRKPGNWLRRVSKN